MKTLEEIRCMDRSALEALALSLDTGRALAEERATVAEGWYQEFYNLMRQSDLFPKLSAYHREKAREYYDDICERTPKNQQP